jgi:soluble lytic murein transglycosylase-like protein
MKNIFILVFLIVLTGCNKNQLTTPNQIKSINYTNYSNEKLKKFITKKSYKVSKAEVDKLAGMINYHSKENNLDPRLVVSLIAVESAFQKNVVSYAGAQGLGQLMPATAKQMGVKNAFDPAENIQGTVKYLNWIKNRAKTNNVDIILASYNMGIGNVTSFLNRKKPFPSDVRGYINSIKSLYQTV